MSIEADVTATLAGADGRPSRRPTSRVHARQVNRRGKQNQLPGSESTLNDPVHPYNRALLPSYLHINRRVRHLLDSPLAEVVKTCHYGALGKVRLASGLARNMKLIAMQILQS